MPSAVARRLFEDQIPSIMSVYEVDSGITDLDQSNPITIVDPKLVMQDGKLPGNSQLGIRPGALLSESVHRHNGSTSTQTTESADSSPTTTVSITDSSDLSDPSPSSSPDSPVHLAHHPSFAPPPFRGLSGMARLTVSDPNQARPMTSPGPRRRKNMKGLSIQPPSNSLSASSFPEPSSPSFIKPTIAPMKRKPSQLSLKTNSSDLIGRTTLEVPSSPTVAPILERRALKHSTSTPHMLSGLRSATFGPVGGMTIPTVLERNESGLSSFFRPARPVDAPVPSSPIKEEGSPIRSQIANRIAFDTEPYHEAENNEDQKSPGYPGGPIAIYSDNVYLYLEPTADEAARFDVVINVAREVTNPFKAASSSQQTPEVKEKPAEDSPIPETAGTTTSFATAYEFFPEDASADTPTTPKAQSFKEPEYIHMPWDHNTNIAPDLMSLCETIDKRTKEGKKVLVHCQQGASRSASLIIAYGLFQHPELSVNDAYYAAQAKSRWISPNMRLMYCLQDFQKEVSKRRLSPTAGLKPRSGRSPTRHRATMSADNIESAPKEPLTAPLPADDYDSASKHMIPERSPNRARGSSTPNRGEPISAGPSSAPSSFSWSEKEDESDPGRFGRFNIDALLAPKETVSISRTPPSPGLVPLKLSRPPMSPGFPPPNPFSRPPPSPGFPPNSFSSRPPPSPGFPPNSSSKAPPSLDFPPKSFSKPSLGFPPKSFSKPSLSLGFPPSNSFSMPPPSPGFPPNSFSMPPPSPGFPPDSFSSRPPPSPGFPPMSFSKPPPSPGFGAHRFGPKPGGFGFTSLNLSPPSKPVVKAEPTPVAILPSIPDEEALLSPREETMTSNPLHPSFAGLAGFQFVENPPTPGDGVFSPRETMFPRDPHYPFGRPVQRADPRSPPTKGETPIVRSIDELL
ncbi:dual specificity phosphatase [Chaetomidium leptoderma]|uniref:protein-tyrosine-phosphatase n=1 Tax=Chaetomidium leptoderma TaxID=669021 RepID=A0AAN6VSZ0_9PEZI|nr:dual specificity phosphatase [Chaetomidium leptoderma]